MRGRRAVQKVFLVGLLAAHIVAGVDVDVAHAGKDQAVVAELEVGSAEPRADLHDPVSFDADLARASTLSVTDDPAGDDHGIPVNCLSSPASIRYGRCMCSGLVLNPLYSKRLSIRCRSLPQTQTVFSERPVP